MTTETKPEPQEAAQAETTAPEAAKAETPAATAETPAAPDYKAMFEAAERARLKLENDRKSQDGWRRSQQERDDALHSRLDATDKRIEAFMRAVASGETDKLPEALSEVDRQTSEARRKAVFGSRVQVMLGDMQEAVLDGDGKPLLDLETAPELAKMRQIATKAIADLDEVAFTAAVAEAHRAARQKERELAKTLLETERKTARETAKAARKAALEEAGVFDTDTGPASGTGEVPQTRFLAEYAAGRLNSPADHVRAAKILKNL